MLLKLEDLGYLINERSERTILVTEMGGRKESEVGALCETAEALLRCLLHKLSQAHVQAWATGKGIKKRNQVGPSPWHLAYHP